MFYSKLNKSSCIAPPLSEKPENTFSGFSSVDASAVEIHTTHSSAPSKLASWKTYFERKTWHSLSPNMKWCNTSQIYSSKEGARSPISESSVAPSSSTALPTALSGSNTGSTATHKKCVSTLPSVPSSSSPSSSPSEKKTASNAVNRSLSDMHAPTWLGLLMCNTVIRVSLFHPLQLALARKRVVQDGSPPSVFQWFKGAYRGGVKMLPGMKSSIDFGQGGTRGLYRGYGSALLSGWTSSIVYLFTMETLKEKFITASRSSEENSSNGGNGDAKGSEASQFSGHRWATAAGATCADALTLCIVTPFAVVVGRQMTSGVGLAADNPYRTVSGTFRHLWHLHQPRAEEKLRRRPLGAGGIASKLWMWMYSGSGGSSFEKGLERSRDGASSTQGSHTSSRSTRPVAHPAHGGWLSAEKAPEGSTISSTSNAAHSKSRVSTSSKGAQPKSLRMPISTGAAAATTRVSSFSSVSAISGATPVTSVTVGAAAQKKSVVSSLLSFAAPNSFLSPSSSSSSRSSPASLWGRERFYPIRRHFWYTVYGARGLYQGLSVALCRIPFSGLWWASYITAKESFYTIASPTLRHLQAAYPNVPGSYWIFSPSDNLLLNAFASASASVLTTLIVSPLSVLQVRLQALSSCTVTEAAGKSNASSKCAKRTVGTVFREKKVGETLTMRHRHIPRSGVKQMATDIFRKEGIRGFYKGVSTNISIAILDGMVFSILFEVTRMLSDVNFGAKSTPDSSAPEVNS